MKWGVQFDHVPKNLLPILSARADEGHAGYTSHELGKAKRAECRGLSQRGDATEIKLQVSKPSPTLSIDSIVLGRKAKREVPSDHIWKPL